MSSSILSSKNQPQPDDDDDDERNNEGTTTTTTTTNHSSLLVGTAPPPISDTTFEAANNGAVMETTVRTTTTTTTGIPSTTTPATITTQGGRYGRSSSDPIIPPPSSIIPLHRKSSILATSYEDGPLLEVQQSMMSPASRLRQRKLHRRGSMLCDGYALLDCLQQQQQQQQHDDDYLSSPLNNTEQGNTTNNHYRNNHHHYRASSTGSFFNPYSSPTTATATTSAQATSKGKQKDVIRQTKSSSSSQPQTKRPSTPPPPQVLTVREESDLDPSVATFASDVVVGYNNNNINGKGNNDEEDQEEYKSAEDEEEGRRGGLANSYPRYFPSTTTTTLFASNDAFASSMRRSVQVLHRQGTNSSSWLTEVAQRSPHSQRLLQSRGSSILLSQQDAKIGSSIAAVAKKKKNQNLHVSSLRDVVVSSEGGRKSSPSSAGSAASTPIEEQIIEVEKDVDDQQKQNLSAAAAAAATKLKDEDDNETTKTQTTKKSIVFLITVLHLIVFSVLGEAMRVFLGWLFSGAGTDCSIDDPNVLCITSSGIDYTGSGVFFEDLPANMVGSFIMGLLQKPQQDLRLVVAPEMGIAFVPSHHWFQDWGIYHLGLRTGFCGSLTTFASWNTQMVRMIDGSATTDGKSNYVAAIFGYVLGLQASVACLSLGQAVAIWMYRAANPALAKEEDVLMYAYTKDAVARDEDEVFDKSKKLPDYETRYLASLLPNEELRWAMQNVALLEHLERWKLSTDEVRLEGDPESKLLKVLHQIEEAVLVDEAQPDEESMKIANDNGWDVDALRTFAKEAHGVTMNNKENLSRNPPFINASRTGDAIMQALVAYLPFVLAVVLFLVMILLDYIGDGDDTIKFEYRKQWITVLFAPAGAIIRWRLARFNGTVKGSYQWFPLGTFIANMVASMVSAGVEGIIDSTRVIDSSNALAVLYGIKTGFAGSMSTVSTFVAEGHQLQSIYPHHAKAFYYVIGSLLFACGCGLLFYSPLARTGP